MIVSASEQQVLEYRQQFLSEINFQLRFHAVFERGWSDNYLIKQNDQIVGYALVKGDSPGDRKDRLFEFFILPDFRAEAGRYFQELIDKTGVRFIQWQTNDRLIDGLSIAVCSPITEEAILFGQAIPANQVSPGVNFRLRREEDQIFEHHDEPVGAYILELQGEVVATGGFLSHYNSPFVDLFMEVSPRHRRMGFGTYLVQEILKEAIHQGKIPAARCNPKNLASKNTLLKAGMKQVGKLMLGERGR